MNKHPLVPLFSNLVQISTHLAPNGNRYRTWEHECGYTHTAKLRPVHCLRCWSEDSDPAYTTLFGEIRLPIPRKRGCMALAPQKPIPISRTRDGSRFAVLATCATTGVTTRINRNKWLTITNCPICGSHVPPLEEAQPLKAQPPLKPCTSPPTQQEPDYDVDF